MADLEAVGPNAEQIRYWNESAGPRWVAHQKLLDAQLAHLGELTMQRAAVAPGGRIVDVGCGCGTTSLELARRAGEGGAVLGVDVSAPMLEVARRRAAEAGVANVRFANADAQTHVFSEGDAGLVFSRFGVMFFADPRAAFANLRRALAPAGRLAFVCWQALKKNPWMAVPLAAAAQHVALPPPPAPDAPGPFSLADPARVEGILAGAGFAQIVLESIEGELTLGGTTDLDEAAAFLIQLGPTSALLRDADDTTRARVTAAIRDAIAPYHGAAGVRMGSAFWVVTARA